MYHFINLTAGLEHLVEYLHMYFMFLRLQSSHLESKEFERFLQEVDNNLLMHLALGRKCCIFDMTSRKQKNNVSRALWQGVPWITYALNRVWFNKETEHKYGMHCHFKAEYACLTKPTKSRLKYYRKFLLTDKIDLGYICEAADHDGDCEFYQDIVEKYL